VTFVRVFLTGRPGCGKSTVIQKVLEGLRKRKIKIAGILTPEIRRDARFGFEIIDIASGKRGTLAAVGLKSKYRVSKYGVSVADIDRIVSEFEKSFAGADAVVIDELGKMEFYSEKFKLMVEKILKSDKPLIATLHRALVKEFKQHGEVILVTPANREQLPKEILAHF
jgi:nucleoside-triphosphatase